MTGLCSICGKLAMPGLRVCGYHQEKRQECGARNYQRRKRLGKCVHCKRKALAGHTMCRYHLDKVRKYMRRVRRRAKVAA